MRNYDRDPILGNGLVFDFQLDEGVGIYVYDQSQNKMTGTGVSLVAGNWVTLANGVVPLMTLDLDGAADYVNLGTAAIFDQFDTTNAITLEAAVLCDDGIASNVIFGGFVTGVGGQACYPQLLLNAGQVEWRPTQDTGETSIAQSVSTYNGSLVHVVATYAESDNVARILLNGGESEDVSVTLVCTNDTLQALGAENAYLGVRNNQGGGPAVENLFDGHIVYVRGWSRRLSTHDQKLLFTRARYMLGL